VFLSPSPSSTVTLLNLGVAVEILVLLTGGAAVAGLIVGVVAVCRSRSAVNRAGRGRAILGLVVSWSVSSVLAFSFFGPPYSPCSPGSSHRVQAQKTVTELRTALYAYYSEYKRWPALPSAAKDLFGDDFLDTRNHDLMDTLVGAPTAAGTTHNRRQIQFLSASPAKAATTRGLWKDPTSGGHHLLDPWGRPYFVLIDANRDNSLNPPTRLDGLRRGPASTSVVVWSYGKDGAAGGGDDVGAF
jgi:hypothetical protein